jgi:hypothetical protein
MPYKKTEPVSERKMDKVRYQGHHTVCETIRKIYQSTDDKEIKYNCRLAFAMAKRMHEQLKRYKQEKEEWLSQKKQST